MSIIKDAPEEIYLVIDGVEPRDTFKDCHDVTWEAEQINDNDVKYIRADKIAALEADAARYRLAIAKEDNAEALYAAVLSCGPIYEDVCAHFDDAMKGGA